MDAKQRADQDRKNCLQDPLQFAKVADDTEVVSDALQCKLALKHFKELSSVDELYALPRNESMLKLKEVLQTKEAQFVLGAEHGVIDNVDFLPPPDACLSEGSTTQVVFRILCTNTPRHSGY